MNIVYVCVLVAALLGCGGGGSSSGEENKVIATESSNSDDSVNESTEPDEAAKYSEAEELLGSLINTRQDQLFSDIDDDQQKIAREMSAKGGLRSGNHLVAIKEMFQVRLTQYLSDIENDIFTIFNNGYLTNSSISLKVGFTESQFTDYINDSLVVDYNSLFSSNIVSQLSKDLHAITSESYRLFKLELTAQGL
jgi:hypothetical protein